MDDFLSIVSDEEGELLGSIFYENVRDWQEYTAPVNDEIRETVLSHHKDRFVIMIIPAYRCAHAGYLLNCILMGTEPMTATR